MGVIFDCIPEEARKSIFSEKDWSNSRMQRMLCSCLLIGKFF